MKFGALLIGASDVKPVLPGVEIDLIDLESFLLSNRGGAWEKGEVQILRSPTKSEVNSALLGLSKVDYAFISCSGHGEHQVYADGLEKTVFCINSNETMPVVEINPGTKRQIILVDVCRQVRKITIKKFVPDSAFAMFESRGNRSQARKRFEEAVSGTSEGRITLYSCGKNQSAGEDEKGGVFTQALIRAAYNCRPDLPSEKVINIQKAFEYANAWVQGINAPQSPEMNAGRRRDFYPFAVSEV